MGERREFFSSRWTLILAALGMAIGTGNIWRFPRIAAQNGGGAFLIPWILFLFLWSIPLIIAEFAIGKKTRLGPAGAIGNLIGRQYTWMGAFVAFCTIAIMFYYSVVMGWCLRYFTAALAGDLSTMSGRAYWDLFQADPAQTLLFHFLSISIGALIIYRGVTRGIETANKILIPSLAILLLIGMVRALTLPNALQGLQFLFSPDWSSLLQYKVWLEALSQSAWSTGAGWGLILTYAVYMREKEDVVLNSFIAGFGNNSASLLAGMVIFPAVFALAPALGQSPTDVLAESGPASTGLTFIWIPELFQELPGAGFFMSVFFLALSVAALSSLIAMIELAARVLMDLGWTRKKSVTFIWIISFVFGIPSAVNMGIFQNQDWVWGVGLILSGFFVAFAANRYGIKRFREELVNTKGSDLKVGKWYEWILRFFIPIQFVILISWWFYQAITEYDPEGWWNPAHTFSVGTCIVQWGVVIGLFLMFNNRLYDRIMAVKGETS